MDKQWFPNWFIKVLLVLGFIVAPFRWLGEQIRKVVK